MSVFVVVDSCILKHINKPGSDLPGLFWGGGVWYPRPDRARSFREQAQLAATEDDRVGSAPLHSFSSQRHRCACLATLAVWLRAVLAFYSQVSADRP